MATAALIGGGLLVGNVLSGIGASKQAKAQAAAAQAQLDSSSQFQATQEGRSQTLFDQNQVATNAQLGLLGQGGDPDAAQNLLDSPLVQAINQRNQENVVAQGAASGVSGGNLLAALQERNTGTILQAGFQGLGSIGGQQLGGSQGFSSLAATGLGMANQAQGNLGQAQGAQDALPFLTAGNIVNQGTQLGAFAASGGFGSPTVAPAGVPAAAPVGSGSNRFSGSTTGFML